MRSGICTASPVLQKVRFAVFAMRPRQGGVTGYGWLRHNIAPLYRCSFELSYTAGTPPQSSGGREEVSLYPWSILARLPATASWADALIAPTLPSSRRSALAPLHGELYL